MRRWRIASSHERPARRDVYLGQIFGTIPVAHAVGGLQKIAEGETGFLYHAGMAGDCATILSDRLVSLARPIIAAGNSGAAGVPEYRRMLVNAAIHVRQQCNWDTIIDQHYFPFYRDIGLATC